MTIRSWPARRWVAAVLAAIATALLIGIPTVLIPTPVFGRSVPVQWWSYPVLAATAVLSGLIFATYVDTGAAPTRRQTRMSLGGGLLSMFAVGCPACNKIAVLLLGMSGALNLWAPVQPLVGVASVGLLAWALQRRLAGERACPVRPQGAGEAVAADGPH
ncbi:MAG TPA: hypothetical protein VFO01_00525 [Trebonia sp.]|nr:hypothetical protein [Trebonia sp.]